MSHTVLSEMGKRETNALLGISLSCMVTMYEGEGSGRESNVISLPLAVLINAFFLASNGRDGWTSRERDIRGFGKTGEDTQQNWSEECGNLCL